MGQKTKEANKALSHFLTHTLSLSLSLSHTHSPTQHTHTHTHETRFMKEAGQRKSAESSDFCRIPADFLLWGCRTTLVDN